MSKFTELCYSDHRGDNTYSINLTWKLEIELRPQEWKDIKAEQMEDVIHENVLRPCPENML